MKEERASERAGEREIEEVAGEVLTQLFDCEEACVHNGIR